MSFGILVETSRVRCVCVSCENLVVTSQVRCVCAVWDFICEHYVQAYLTKVDDTVRGGTLIFRHYIVHLLIAPDSPLNRVSSIT